MQLFARAVRCRLLVHLGPPDRRHPTPTVVAGRRVLTLTVPYQRASAHPASTRRGSKVTPGRQPEADAEPEAADEEFDADAVAVAADCAVEPVGEDPLGADELLLVDVDGFAEVVGVDGEELVAGEELVGGALDFVGVVVGFDDVGLLVGGFEVGLLVGGFDVGVGVGVGVVGFSGSGEPSTGPGVTPSTEP
jgi:hypothetical protein